MSTFEELSQKEVELYLAKNHDYAKGGDWDGNFKRVAAILAQYPGLTGKEEVAVVYMLKQLDAALWMLSQGHTSKTGEGIGERLKDISVYAKILRLMVEANPIKP